MKLYGFAILFVLVSVETYAAQDSPPLWPGTRIIPGDLTKNEFFIVAQNDIPKIVKSLSKKKTQTQTSGNANHQAKNQSSKMIPKLKVALEKISKKKNKSVKKIFLTDSKQTNCSNTKSNKKIVLNKKNHKKNFRKLSQEINKDRKLKFVVHHKLHQHNLIQKTNKKQA